LIILLLYDTVSAAEVTCDRTRWGKLSMNDELEVMWMIRLLVVLSL